MKNSQKGFVVPLIIIIILAAIGGVGYVWQKKKVTNVPAVTEIPTNKVSTVTSASTKDWKTFNIYREAGEKVLSVVYPPTWTIGDYPNDCQEPKTTPSRLLSLPQATDVTNHVGETLSFVVDLCINEENKKAVNFIGFVTTATNMGVGHNVMNIPTGEIEKRKEYSTAQEIIKANHATVLPNRIVTVLSPNGLGTLKAGETYTIEWWDDNDAGNRDISVISYLRDEKPVILATNSFMRSSGVDGIYRYTWKIGAAMKGNYKIQVCKSGTKECDLSDAWFTITN